MLSPLGVPRVAGIWKGRVRGDKGAGERPLRTHTPYLPVVSKAKTEDPSTTKTHAKTQSMRKVLKRQSTRIKFACVADALNLLYRAPFAH